VIRLAPEEHAPLARYIHSICAVTLDQSKTYLMEGRLGRLVDECGCASFTQFLERARSDPSRAIERRIVDAITTGETLFFRDSAPFDLLRDKILPELISRRARGGPPRLRIWSAACSTGQEVYSIAILLKELLGDPDRYGVRLLGTDISDQAVARASRGIFSPVEMARGLTEQQRAMHFSTVAGGWQIRDEIRAMASFKKLNLMQDFSSLGKFDVIFCRNVAIYFSEPDRASLFRRIERAMDPGAYLLIGGMESLGALCPQFESKRHLRAVYYQVKAAAAAPVQARDRAALAF
jgi:chemotaxis protein methyltransferase CheR